jgi:acetoin utilization deacetylase AcuC-like enzyme
MNTLILPAPAAPVWNLTRRFLVFFNDYYSEPDIDFETIKKAAKIAEVIRINSDLAETMCIEDPQEHENSISEAVTAIEKYVDPAYLSALRAGHPSGLAASNGLGWDPALVDMVVNSTAGIMSALRDVKNGQFAAASLSSGLHHASPTRGSGYCTVNSLAIAALVAASRGLRVVILDLDAHCGGGTNAYLTAFPELAARITHLDVSLSSFDSYKPRAGDMLELTNDDEYITAVDRALKKVALARPDVVFYNAGVDIWPQVSPETVAQRDHAVATVLREIDSRCVIVMAGGYGADEQIVPLHIETLKAFASRKPSNFPTVLMEYFPRAKWELKMGPWKMLQR